MVTIVSAIVVGLFVAASGAHADGIEPITRNPNLPAIKSITIKENAARAPAADESNEQCAQFVLSKREVEGYIRAAGEVTQEDYRHMIDWSPCYASGDVLFENGVTGVWGIQQLRGGSLKLSNGRTIYLYCPKCKAMAFGKINKSAEP